MATGRDGWLAGWLVHGKDVMYYVVITEYAVHIEREVRIPHVCLYEYCSDASSCFCACEGWVSLDEGETNWTYEWLLHMWTDGWTDGWMDEYPMGWIDR